MKLVNAKLFEEQIRRKMWEIWYDEKYQYYFGGNWRTDFSLADNNDYPKRSFAVLNNSDELIGYISYAVNTELRIAQWFGAINFSDDKFAFGQALRQVITDCFLKFGMEVVEWNVTAECSECCDERKEIWAGFFPDVPPSIARGAALVSAESVKLSNYCPNCGAKMDLED